jgi:hypothetical protein
LAISLFALMGPSFGMTYLPRRTMIGTAPNSMMVRKLSIAEKIPLFAIEKMVRP